MPWPTTLTDRASLMKYSAEIAQEGLIPPGRDLTPLHQGAAIEIRNFVEDERVQDADQITNPSVYEPAAAYWVLSRLFRERSENEKADYYGSLFVSAVRQARPRVADRPDRGGNLATPALFKRGSTGIRGRGAIRHYDRRRGRRFG